MGSALGPGVMEVIVLSQAANVAIMMFLVLLTISPILP